MGLLGNSVFLELVKICVAISQKDLSTQKKTSNWDDIKDKKHPLTAFNKIIYYL